MEMMRFLSQYFQLIVRTPVFFKRFLFEIVQISTDCHIKTCRSLKRRAILKTPSADF